MPGADIPFTNSLGGPCRRATTSLGREVGVGCAVVVRRRKERVARLLVMLFQQELRRCARPPSAIDVEPITVNVDVLGPHGVASTGMVPRDDVPATTTSTHAKESPMSASVSTPRSRASSMIARARGTSSRTAAPRRSLRCSTSAGREPRRAHRRALQSGHLDAVPRCAVRRRV